MSVLAIVFALFGIACICETPVGEAAHSDEWGWVGITFFAGAYVIAVLIATGSIAR